MYRNNLVLFVALLFSVSVSAQVPSPTPTPTPARDDGEVVKISTALIQLDVTVVDRKGNPITDLGLDEFEMYENGQKQKISGVSFVSSVNERRPATERPDPTQPPIPAPTIGPQQVRRTIALVVDDLSLSFESVYYTRRALKKFVDEQMSDGDLVAIIRTGAGIGALQQFTSDKRMLYAAIERVRWNPMGRGGVTAFAPIEPSPLEQAIGLGDTTGSGGEIDDEGEFEAGFEEFRESAYVTGTLGALRFIVTGMTELPGRKSVILFSDGFRVQFNQDTGQVREFFRRLVDAANRASVVFYTLDARGLQVTGPTAADQITNTSPQAYSRLLSSRSNFLFETQAALQELAKETGGIAYVNQNDLTRGMRKVLDDQSYYLLSYEPEDATFDPATRRFNKIEIRVTRPGATVRYRSGFFNVADENIAKAKPVGLTPDQEIQRALTSPFAMNGVELSLATLYGNDAKAGHFVRSLLHVNVGDLKFDTLPDGKKKAEVAILAAVFGDNGAIIDHVGRSFAITVTDEALRKFIAEGFVYHFTFPVKKPGAYQYRIAVRDMLTGAVGSANQFIEVPNLKRPAPVISGIVLESMSQDDWQKVSASNGAEIKTDPLRDSSLRRFKRGSVLRFGYEVYNARAKGGVGPQVSAKIRLFNEGKLIMDGTETELTPVGDGKTKRLSYSSGINLPENLSPGEYILQVVVVDRLAKEKRRLASRAVSFEVVD